ncbi:hypothetical protein [Terasakiella sp.]|uniref:hypothetical protein n=1 Tax=Terasakiella sp. TaxID=2034861 RepID=UPI003AA93DB7
MAKMSNFSSTLGPSYNVNGRDVLGAKGTLSQLGYYEVPAHGFTEWPDTPMFNGIQKFQKDRNLIVDAIIKPNGPTEQAMNRALQEKFTNQSRMNSNSLFNQFDKYNSGSFYNAGNRFAESYTCCATGTCDNIA